MWQWGQRVEDLFFIRFRAAREGRKTVDIQTDDKRHNTTREGIDKREPVRVSFLKMKKFKERALDDKRTDFVFVESCEIFCQFSLDLAFAGSVTLGGIRKVRRRF